VVIFAVVKFTEGAWLVVVVFPLAVYAFIRLNREYRTEAQVLERIGDRPKPPGPPNYPRRTVLVLVDSFDLATLAALRYARSQRPTTLRAVHLVMDPAQATLLREEWTRADRGVVLDFIDVPDRRLVRAATELVSMEAAQPGTHVTVVLPRRSYSPLLGRLLHDRTADKIAAAVSRIPQAAATIIPFDVRSRIESLHARQTQDANGKTKATAATTEPPASAGPAAGASNGERRPVPASPAAALRGSQTDAHASQPRAAANGKHPSYERPAPSPGATPIGSIQAPRRAAVEGRVRTVELRPVEDSSVLAIDISDSTGDLTALFYGRSNIPGIMCGTRVRFRGRVGIRPDRPVMINPAYELL